MAKSVCWRLHTASPPDTLYQFWTTDTRREQFWAETSRPCANGFELTFPDGSKECCLVLLEQPPSLFAFTYFNSKVTVHIASDGMGGSDLTLVNEDVSAADFEEVHAGWLSVLLPLKAAIDFGIDLRNHDPARTWQQEYVDQ